jgi:hypothetical protein
VYLGWITVATIANATSLLEYLDWSGWGISDEVWAIIMLIAGASIASVVTLTRNDIAYMLVIIWAFVGIAVKHGDSPAVATAAWVVTALAVLVLVVGIVLGRRQKQQLTTT